MLIYFTEVNMTDYIFGGIEGGASKSSAVLINGKGEKLSEAEGPLTNLWAIGMEECQRRINNLIEELKKKANLPPDTVIKSLGLSLSGCERDETNKELRDGMIKDYPKLSENYMVCSDTIAPIIVAHEDGGVVLICGTGTNALLINPDGTQGRCGGWGYILGDEGGAGWIALKLIKVFIDEQDNFEPPPHGYSTKRMWEVVKKYFNIETRFDLLPHFYGHFDKSKIAGIVKHFAEVAKAGDPLCCWGFAEAGKAMAKHLTAVAPSAHKDLLNIDGGLPVVCVGSVWKSWDLLKPGFVKHLEEHQNVPELSLLELTTNVATGAAYLAAKSCNYVIPKSASVNYKVFYHYKRCNVE